MYRHHCSGSATQAGNTSPTSELKSALTPTTSHLEGVGTYACAATSLIHCTPPPFNDPIVHWTSDVVKPFLKIRLQQANIQQS